MITFMILGAVGLAIGAVCSTLIIVEYAKRFHFKSDFVFAMTYGVMVLGWLMAIVFIGNLCAEIASMS